MIEIVNISLIILSYGLLEFVKIIFQKSLTNLNRKSSGKTGS